MSIELNWETLTTGPDGDELAARIRDFIHAKFQTVPLPRFIKSVTVHAFEFGNIAPELELKDITDPLPDFYEEDPDVDYDTDDDDEEEEGEEDGGEEQEQFAAVRAAAAAASSSSPPPAGRGASLPSKINTRLRRGQEVPAQDLTSPFLGVMTPGILSGGGTSNFSYFHSHLASSGLSGTQTPLAAVAGAHLGGHHHSHSWQDGLASGSGGGAGLGSRGRGGRTPVGSPLGPGDISPSSFTPAHSRHSSISALDAPSAGGGGGGLVPPQQQRGQGQGQGQGQILREKHSVSTLAPTSVGTSRPPTRDTAGNAIVIAEEDDHPGEGGGDGGEDAHDEHGGHDGGGRGNNNKPNDDGRRFRERRIEDLQAVFRIRYAGNIRMLLTADILLDYPMPSFVGIPVRLSITGLTFDGVGVLAHIRKRLHFCFLSPEDALAAVGNADATTSGEGSGGGGEAGSGAGGETSLAGAESGATASSSTTTTTRGTRMGGLLQEIRVESEIGQRESGKQSLRNVGKVERFVLEQVRRIFEEELVYPSFWTFLV